MLRIKLDIDLGYCIMIVLLVTLHLVLTAGCMLSLVIADWLIYQ